MSTNTATSSMPAQADLLRRLAVTHKSPSPRPISSPPRQNHLFVDNVRFWSMLAIIALHSCTIFVTAGKATPTLILAITTPFKFGTIAFFLISGFLLGERLETCRPLEYLNKRLQKIFLPWLTWLSLSVAFFLTAKVLQHRLTLSFSLDTLGIIAQKYVACTFTSALWFVPNLLLSLCVLLLFRRHLRDLRFGAVLLAVDAFYVVNIYRKWIPTNHTEALFGFVFYLWLGAYAAIHFTRLSAWVARIPTGALAALSVATGLLAYSEAQFLTHLGSADAMNTLRLSNQIFSVSVVLLLLKLRHATWPRFVDVRKHTFGLYLSHSLVQSIVMRLVDRPYSAAPNAWIFNNPAGLTVLWFAVAVTIYSVSLTITKAIYTQSLLRWSIGSGDAGAQSKASPRLLPALDLQAAPELASN